MFQNKTNHVTRYVFTQGGAAAGEDDHSASQALLCHRESRTDGQRRKSGPGCERTGQAAARGPGDPSGTGPVPALPRRGAQTGRHHTQDRGR